MHAPFLPLGGPDRFCLERRDREPPGSRRAECSSRQPEVVRRGSRFPERGTYLESVASAAFPACDDVAAGRNVLLIHEQNEVARVVAVLDEHVDSCVSQQSGQCSELSRRLLIQPGHDDVTYDGRTYPGSSDGGQRGRTIVDQVVRHRLSGMGEHSAAFQAHPGTAERLAEVDQRARPVGQKDLEVLQSGTHEVTTVVVTSTRMDRRVS
jgi:hypothetical protein